MTTLVSCVLVKFVKKVGVFGRWHFHESNKEKTMVKKRENKLGWKFLFFLLFFLFLFGEKAASGCVASYNRGQGFYVPTLIHSRRLGVN